MFVRRFRRASVISPHTWAGNTDCGAWMYRSTPWVLKFSREDGNSCAQKKPAQGGQDHTGETKPPQGLGTFKLDQFEARHYWKIEIE